jgi:ribosomal-protein-alanine N-acetyltransferase
MDVRLRPMRWSDIDPILPLEQELFAGDPPWSGAQFRSELAGVPDTRWYVVAEHGGQIVGYAGLLTSVMTGDPADIQTIAVASGYQRRGIGTLLMDELIAEAGRRDASELLLDVRVDNDVARRFYEGYGFTEFAVRRNYYHDHRDGLVMRKRLRSEPKE